ncbi:asparagine synthase-related protein [Mesorhizobium australicum]|uniref:asparagine synthase-related protein n=1 Tax=Mesorhizobium australicum TaxID=536018 RepID=UPI00333AF28B
MIEAECSPAFRLVVGDESVRTELGAATSLLNCYADTETVVLVLGRIYYRQALMRRLPASTVSRLVNADPARLVAAVYSETSERGLGEIEGDFCLIIYDRRADIVLAARDPFGGYPLYWADTPAGLVFSSTVAGVVQMLPCAEVDDEYLADMIMAPGGVFEEAHSDRCAYRGVTRVRAGARVRIECDNGKVATARRDWLDHIVEPVPDEPQEVSEHFAALLSAAVSERVQGETACHLSGGFDSTTITLLSQRRQRQIGGPPIHTLSLVFDKLATLRYERPFIDAVLHAHPDLIPHPIAADGFGAYVSYPAHDEPWPALFWSRAELAMVEAAAAAGATTILTGLGADEQIDMEPYSIADALRGLRLSEAWSTARVWADSTGVNMWSLLSTYGVAQLLPVSLVAGLGEEPRARVPSWIRPEFARRHDLVGRGRAVVRRIYRSHRSPALSLALYGMECRQGDLSRWYMAAPRGIHEAHPFLDPRVAGLGLGIQWRMAADPRVSKPIIRQGFAELLPEAILERADTGHFNEYVFAALAREEGRLRELVVGLDSACQEIFDVEALLLALQRASLGAVKNVSSLDRLVVSLSVVVWMTHHQAWLARPIVLRDGPSLTRPRAAARLPAKALP